MINITELEEFIVATLAPLKDEENVAIIPYPDGGNYPRVAGAGFAIVAFAGESLVPPNGRNQGRGFIQSRTVQFEVSLHLQELRSHAGAYPIIDRIRGLITGASPPGCEPHTLYCSSTQFASRINGFWIYRVVIEIDVPLVHKKR